VTRLAARLLCLVLCATTIGCDQVTKQIAADELGDGARHSLLYDSVRLQYAENPGAFLGLGAQLPQTIRTPLLAGAALLLLLGVAYALRDQRNMALPHRLGLYLILAAGFSNLWDRLLRGRVIDFLNIGVGPLRTGIFNVADVALMAGLGMILLAHHHKRTRVADGALP
jgi:signal peptidase II